MLGFPTVVHPSNTHVIHCIESDVPGVFEIKCSCGEVTWTPWGEEHAQEISEIHLWARGVKYVPGQRRITTR